ncbi:MAG: cysteine desulfurase family protein [Acidimicrobiales bacterium]|jgi:cysteine desulfurase
MTSTPSRQVAYLDNAATTPMRPEVLEAMLPWMTTAFGNASAGHSMARTARRAVDDARDTLAEVLGCDPGDVVFTSGGTEADNLAVTGVALAARERGVDRPLIGCSAVEHPAVLEPVRAAGGEELPVDADGLVDIARLEDWLSRNSGRVVEVSVMLVNNETGVIQSVADVARLTRELAPRALVHTDAVQGLGWLDVASLAEMADLITVSAHKIGGPKGVGALIVRSEARRQVRPVQRGGPQERELRAGTHDVAGIVGMACAARLCSAERAVDSRRVEVLAGNLVTGVLAAVAGSGAAVPADRRIAAICNLFFEGVESEELLLVLDELGVCASAGSACASGALEPSHVLLAMGRSPQQARQHVRLSLGRSTTVEDVDQAVAAIPEAVARLRGGR